MVTYNDVMLARMVFEKFWEQDLPFLLAEKIENFLLETNPIRDEVENKREELLLKYAKKDENGCIMLKETDANNNPIISIEDEDLFYNNFNNFLDTEINYSFDEDNFFTDNDLTFLKCSPEDIKNVKWFTKLRSN